MAAIIACSRWALCIAAATLCAVGAAQDFPNGWKYPTNAVWMNNGNWLAVPPQYTSGFYHIGRDIGGGAGSNVYAMFDGVVEFEQHGGDVVNNQLVWLKHRIWNGAYIYIIYAHINHNKRQGDVVRKGDVIGTVASYPGGGDHLHLGVRPSGVLLSGWGRGAIPSGWNGDINTLDTRGFVPPWTYLSTNDPWRDAPQIELYNLPAGDRYFTHNVEVPWRVISGSDPLTVQELINGNVVASYPTHSGYVNHAAGGPGWHQCWARVSNNAGSNETPQRWNGGFDNVPPYAQRSSGALPNNWYKGTHSVAWNVADGHSGPKRFRYRWNQGGWSNWFDNPNGGRELPTFNGSSFLGEGQRVLEVEVEDNAWAGGNHAGNFATVNLGSYWLDNTAPTVESPILTPGSPTNQASVAVEVSATDGLSGIQRIEVLVDGSLIGTVTSASGTITWPTAGAPDGSHQISAVAYDHAGNASAPSQSTVVLDRAGPTTSISISPPAPNGLNGWYRTAPLATVIGSDPTPSSGLAGSWYSINGQAFVQYTASFPLNGSGLTSLAAYSKDAAGNSGETAKVVLKIDSTPPPAVAVLDEGQRTPIGSNLNVAITGSPDPESGHFAYDYAVGDASNPERWRGITRVVTSHPFLIIEGLALPLGATAVVYVRPVNGAGAEGEWSHTDGIVFDAVTGDLMIMPRVMAMLGFHGVDGDLEHHGTLGETVVGASDDSTLVSGFWGPFTLQDCSLNSVLVTHALASAGGLPQLALVDQQYLTLQQSPLGGRLDPNAAYVCSGTSPFEAPSNLALTLVSACDVSPSASVRRTIELYDWIAASWVVVAEDGVSATDTTKVAVVPGAQRFVQAGTRQLQVRVAWRQVDSPLSRVWYARTDQLKILVQR